MPTTLAPRRACVPCVHALVLWAVLLPAALAPAQSAPPSPPSSAAPSPASALPPPFGLGASAALLGPSPLSAPLGAHLRLTGFASSSPDDPRSWSGGLHAAASVTLWDRGEAGLSYLLRFDPDRLLHGPLTGWLRAGPFFPLSSDRSGLLLAPFLEYATAPPPFDAAASLLRDTLTLGSLAGHRRGRWLAYLSAAFQRGQSPGVLYQGGQLGAAVFARATTDLELGAELLARFGCRDADCAHSVLGVLVVRLLDRHGVGFTAGAGRGLGASAPGWTVAARLALSVGQGWHPPPPDPTYLVPDPVPPWLMAAYSRWFPGWLIDPVLSPSGWMLDDDGTLLYHAADPDPDHPGLLRLRHSGQRFAPGTHFYRAGRTLLTEDGRTVESIPPFALARHGALRLSTRLGASLDRALASHRVQAAADAASTWVRLSVLSASGFACGVATGILPAGCLQRQDPVYLANLGWGRAAAGAGQLLIGMGGELLGWGLDVLPPTAPVGAAVGTVSGLLVANGGRAMVQGGLDLRQAVQLVFRKPGEPPNPWGMNGAPDHQATVERLDDKALAEFPDTGRYEIVKNQSILDKSGVNRRPDVTVVDRLTGKVVKVYEAARTNKAGIPVARERKKVQEYTKAGIPVHVEPVR